jgi:hypothetical protein
MWALGLTFRDTSRADRGVTAQETQEWGLAGMKCRHDSFVIAASALIATVQIPLYSQRKGSPNALGSLRTATNVWDVNARLRLTTKMHETQSDNSRE